MKIIVHRDGRIVYFMEIGGFVMPTSRISDLRDAALASARKELAQLEAQGYQIEYERKRDSRPLFADYAHKDGPNV